VPAIFDNYRIIFLLKILWNRSTVRWTESTVAGARVHELSLNERHRLADQQHRLKNTKGVSDNLIVAVNAGMDGSRWHAQPTAAAHRSKPLPPFWSTKLDMAFTYDIVVTWGTRFANHGTAADGGGHWRWRGGSVGFRRRHRQAPVLGMIDSARAAVSFTRWLGFGLLQIKICQRTGTIYRAFCTEL
jgi:hypothetical protein